MEGNIFNIPMDMSFQNSLINDATFPLSHSNSQDPNTQNPIMSAFPVLSMLQGEPICDLNTGLHLPNQNPNPNPNSAAALIHNQFMNGMPISAASLATLLAARYNNNPQENLNDDIIIPSTFPHPNEAMRPNGFCDTNTMIADYPPLMGFSPFQLMGNLEPNRWISSENNTSVSSCSNELSLSLGNCQPICSNANSDRELSCSGLSEQGQNRNLCLGFGSSKPVEFSEVLSGSGYLHVMREILSEIASFSLDDNHRTSYTAAGGIGGGANPSSSSSRNEFCDGDERSEGHIQPFFRSQEVESKKKHMLDLLEVVDNRYNRCMDEIHTVISAFHAVTDLDPQIHARFAIQTVSVMYKNLRERISNYILAMGTNSRRGISSGRREETEEKSFESSFIQKQWALQQLKRKDHQLWRPQRGLPEKSVAVLRAWMFQNFLHPYPKDAEKHLLAVKSGLTRSQVSNWFINARVRLWKPMIEEMYSEMNRRKNRARNDQGSNRSNFLNNISIDYERFKMI